MGVTFKIKSREERSEAGKTAVGINAEVWLGSLYPIAMNLIHNCV